VHDIVKHTKQPDIYVRVVVDTYVVKSFGSGGVAVFVVDWPKSDFIAAFGEQVIPDAVLDMVQERGHR